MALIAVLLTSALGERMRRGVFDSWQRLRPHELSASDVRVVMIDNQSIEFLGAWPWPRYYLARLTEELANRGAKVIAFDILFAEHDRVRPETFVSLYPELSASAAAEVQALKPMDQLFGGVIGSAPVVLGHAGVDEPPAEQPPLADAPIRGELPPATDSWPAELAAIPELDDVALGSGLMNGRPDSDGVVRVVPLVMRAGGKPRMSFAMEIARNTLGAENVQVTPSSVRIGDRAVPIDRQGRMQLHFGHFPAEKIVSAAEVIGKAKRLKPDMFDGKPVIIGLSAEGTSDIAATPLAAEEYGPLIQAQAVDAMLRGGWLQRPAWAGPAEWAAAALLALLALGNALYGRSYRILLAVIFLAVPIAVGWPSPMGPCCSIRRGRCWLAAGRSQASPWACSPLPGRTVSGCARRWSRNGFRLPRQTVSCRQHARSNSAWCRPDRDCKCSMPGSISTPCSSPPNQSVAIISTR
jgi:CHASE2 domain-containing sensor protein